MPNKEQLQLLVNALVSGEFPQARDALRTTKGYCCLGVACEIYRRETGKGRWGHGFDKAFDFIDAEGVSMSFLPQSVAKWLDTRNLNVDYRVNNIEFSFEDRDGGQVKASLLNDHGCTFPQIAQIIAWEYGLKLPEAAHAVA